MRALRTLATAIDVLPMIVPNIRSGKFSRARTPWSGFTPLVDEAERRGSGDLTACPEPRLDFLGADRRICLPSAPAYRRGRGRRA